MCRYTKLYTLRIEKGYSCAYIAGKLKISKSYYWQIENGSRRLYYDIAKKISEIFGLKPDDIFYEK